MSTLLETNGLMTTAVYGNFTSDPTYGADADRAVLIYRPNATSKGTIRVSLTDAQGTVEHHFSLAALTTNKVLIRNKSGAPAAPEYDSSSNEIWTYSVGGGTLDVSVEVAGKADCSVTEADGSSQPESSSRVDFKGSGQGSADFSMAAS